MKKPEIIYEDQWLLVCRKEAGIAVQTARAMEPDMVSMLKNGRAAKGEPPYIAVISRLDQPVEGLLVFAKDKKTAAGLSRELQKDQWVKEYLAVTEKIPETDSGSLTDWLLKNGRTNRSEAVPEGRKGTKKAVLSWQKLAEKDGRALLRIHLKTGRHHQIRVQLSHAGWPISGDRKYGETQSGKPDTDQPGSGDRKYGEMQSNKRVAGRPGAGGRSQLALCAAHLEFIHPVTGKRMEFSTVPKGGAFSAFSEELAASGIVIRT